MNDPIDRLMDERQRLDGSFPATFVISLTVHVLFLGLAIGVPLLFPSEPLLRVADGIAVPMPPGGRGVPDAPPPREGTRQAAAEAPQPDTKVEPPPKVLKPPKEEARQGLAMPDAKAAKRKPAETKASGTPRPALGLQQTGAPGGTGTGQATPGLALAPEGPGVPGGTDMFGDFYMASVQRKIWMLWTQQPKPGAFQPVTISFAILRDGSVTDIRVVQSSGAFLLDLAAQRAVSSSAPFGPLPKNYETNRYTVQAVFKTSM